jgi:hypothetical protein
MKLIDPTNPTEAERLAAFEFFLALQCDDEAFQGTTVDGNTVTQPDGWSAWVVTRHEVKGAGLWSDNLDEFNFGGTTWVVMPL